MYELFIVGDRYVSDVQVGVFGLVAVGSRQSYFEAFVLDLVAVEGVDGFACVLLVHVFHEAVAKAVAYKLFDERENKIRTFFLNVKLMFCFQIES